MFWRWGAVVNKRNSSKRDMVYDLFKKTNKNCSIFMEKEIDSYILLLPKMLYSDFKWHSTCRRMLLNWYFLRCLYILPFHSFFKYLIKKIKCDSDMLQITRLRIIFISKNSPRFHIGTLAIIGGGKWWRIVCAYKCVYIQYLAKRQE